MNFIDRAVAFISPEAGLRRAGARKRLQIINSGYGNYGANTTKKSLKGWIFGGGSAREDIEDNLPVLRERCRDLYMGVPLATGALKTCRTNVVGQGLTLKSQIDYEYLGLEEEDAQPGLNGNLPCGRIPRPAIWNGWTISRNYSSWPS